MNPDVHSLCLWKCLNTSVSVSDVLTVLSQVMGHRVRSMFASARRPRGAGALHSLRQQKDRQRRL